MDNIFSDFYDAAKARVDSVAAKYAALPNDSTNSIGGSIFEAVYQYGRGAYDKARANIAEGILKTSEGQKVAAAVEQQRLKEYLPWIIGAIILTLGGMFLLARR